MFSQKGIKETRAVVARTAQRKLVMSLSKVLSVLATTSVLVGGCHAQYSYPTGALLPNYGYQTSYVPNQNVYYQARYGYDRWPYHGYPYRSYGTQNVRYLSRNSCCG